MKAFQMNYDNIIQDQLTFSNNEMKAKINRLEPFVSYQL